MTAISFRYHDLRDALEGLSAIIKTSVDANPKILSVPFAIGQTAEEDEFLALFQSVYRVFSSDDSKKKNGLAQLIQTYPVEKWRQYTIEAATAFPIDEAMFDVLYDLPKSLRLFSLPEEVLAGLNPSFATAKDESPHSLRYRHSLDLLTTVQGWPLLMYPEGGVWTPASQMERFANWRLASVQDMASLIVAIKMERRYRLPSDTQCLLQESKEQGLGVMICERYDPDRIDTWETMITVQTAAIEETDRHALDAERQGVPFRVSFTEEGGFLESALAIPEIIHFGLLVYHNTIVHGGAPGLIRI